MTGLGELTPESSKAGRVSPQSEAWHRFWEMFPNRRRIGVSWETPSPPILATRWYTPDSERRQRPYEHLKWDHWRGAADAMSLFLAQWRLKDWYTEP